MCKPVLPYKLEGDKIVDRNGQTVMTLAEIDDLRLRRRIGSRAAASADMEAALELIQDLFLRDMETMAEFQPYLMVVKHALSMAFGFNGKNLFDIAMDRARESLKQHKGRPVRSARK